MSAELDTSVVETGWLPLMRQWLVDAVEADAPEPNAMTSSTVDDVGRPASRTVLCKGLSEDGVLFFTNYGSDKARHLDAHPYASANFTWLTLARQVIVRGTTERVSAQLTQEYWRTRPRGSQLGAWASSQSRPIDSPISTSNCVRSLLDSAWTVRFRCHRTGAGSDSARVCRVLARTREPHAQSSSHEPGRRTVVRRPSPAVSKLLADTTPPSRIATIDGCGRPASSPSSALSSAWSPYRNRCTRSPEARPTSV